ncbi:MAG: mcpB 4 [Firmicutes bacterium]|nr:mcpB 4 [Bacillota bacterium]
MKKKLLLFLLITSCVPLVIISFVSMYFFDNNVKNSYHDLSRTKLEQLQFEMQGLTNKHLDLLKMLANNPAIRNFDVANSKPILVEASRAFPMMVPIVVDTAKGSQIVKSDDSKLFPDISDRKFFQVAMKGQTNISDTIVSKDNNHMIIVLATPIRSQDGAAVTGVLQGTIDLDMLIDVVSKKSQDGVVSYIADREGKLIAHPERERVAKREDLSKEAFIQSGLKGENGSVEIKDENGVRKLVNYAQEPTTGWVIVQEIPLSVLSAKSQSLIWTVSIVVFLTLVLTVIAGFFASNKITQPIKIILEECNLLAQGDIRDIETRVRSNDEIGQLAKGFRDMRTNLRALVAKVQSQAEHLAASSQQLTASAGQSSLAASQVATSITSVTAGVEEQLTATSQASEVATHMSAGISQVAAKANQVATQSEQTVTKAKNGGQAVETAIGQMARIETTVNASSQVVAKLGERSKEIGQIVDAISSIAGQTNLLALNAAIEAARAGEQGRGFAVVAEEVRKLAEQSQEAAKKIAELIGEIQQDTDKAVVAMNDGTREVKTGAEVVNAAGLAFREITGLVNDVSGHMQEISAAIQQVASGSQQIVGAVKKIDELSIKSTDETQNVSAATEEQLASMEEIAASSEALSKLAQDLQYAVAKFRI